jgi:UDP-glucuronate decarboxylase
MTQAARTIVAEDIARILEADLPWSTLSGATVAVTGATGFIGSYVVRTLLALHASGKVDAPVRVIGVARDMDKVARRFPDLGRRADLDWVQCDLARPEGLSFRADWIFHAASPASPKLYGVDPVGTIAPNVLGTWRLLELASRSRARGLMFISSSEVYGQVPNSGLLREDDYGALDPTTVRSVYAESKRMGETLSVAWMHQSALPVFIVRPFHTYGPGVDLADGRVFADFVADVVAGRPIRLSSDGTARRAFCYISDAVAGFFHVLLRGEAGRAYNIGNPEGDLSIRELAELLAREFADRGVRVDMQHRGSTGTYLPSPHARLVPCIDRAGTLGWRPRVAPAEGFRRMVESYAHEA